MSDDLIEEMSDGVVTLTMNQPEARNAMTGPMMSKMHEALPRLAADKSVRCLVLTGAGEAFCAGGDVKGFASEAGRDTSTSNSSYDLEGRTLSLRSGMELSRLLHGIPKPTLAAIPGPAAGGGLSLALACDLRIAVDTCEADHGIFEDWLVRRLRRIIFSSLSSRASKSQGDLLYV